MGNCCGNNKRKPESRDSATPLRHVVNEEGETINILSSSSDINGSPPNKKNNNDQLAIDLSRVSSDDHDQIEKQQQQGREQRRSDDSPMRHKSIRPFEDQRTNSNEASPGNNTSNHNINRNSTPNTSNYNIGSGGGSGGGGENQQKKKLSLAPPAQQQSSSVASQSQLRESSPVSHTNNHNNNSNPNPSPPSSANLFSDRHRKQQDFDDDREIPEISSNLGNSRDDIELSNNNNDDEIKDPDEELGSFYSKPGQRNNNDGGEPVRMFNQKSLSEVRKTRSISLLVLFLFYFSQKTIKSSDSEHESNKLNHFKKLGRATLVTDGANSLLGGRGGRGSGAAKQRKTAVAMAAKPENQRDSYGPNTLSRDELKMLAQVAKSGTNNASTNNMNERNSSNEDRGSGGDLTPLTTKSDN
jgi:hypothetical protein